MLQYYFFNKNISKGLRYYQRSIDLDLISKGEDYRNLAKSYNVFICTFDLFDKGRLVKNIDKKVLKLSVEGYTISQIAKECDISED